MTISVPYVYFGSGECFLSFQSAEKIFAIFLLTRQIFSGTSAHNVQFIYAAVNFSGQQITSSSKFMRLLNNVN